MDLWLELERLRNELLVSIKQLRKTGQTKAETERDYYVAKASESLRLKEQGQSVTMIQLIIKGQKEVAEKLFKYHVAEVTHQANLEHVNSTKIQMRILESQISREFGQANGLNS